MAIKGIVNLDDAVSRAKLINSIRLLHGQHRVEIIKHYPRRTDRQNRYYWPCFVTPFSDWLSDQGDDPEAAHEILKRRFLTKHITNKDTGESVEWVGSTTKLTTVEFNEYLDKCAQFLAEFCGIEVPEPNIYHEPEEVAA